ncbi:MAG: SURF1 family protein [Burkholderiaceae bacterium]
MSSPTGAISRARARQAIVALAALASLLLTLRLGWWQLERAAQKTALQSAIELRSSLPVIDGPTALATSAEAAAAQHHRRLRISGQWLPAHTVYLDNRQMGGRQGFYVVTPLRLDDGTALVVQRGWQPRDFQQRDRIQEVSTPRGRVELEGRIAPPPALLYAFALGETGRIRQNLELEPFARESGLNLRPLALLLTEPQGRPGVPGPDGLQRDWPAPAAGVGKHHGYAAQWFALAALIFVLYVWFQLIQPRRAGRRQPS